MKFNSDLKFFLTGLIGGIITLFLPVLLWNVWCLDYIDQYGKFVAWCLAPVFAGISAGIFVGFSYTKKQLIGSDQGREGKEINPFWGWAAVALVIEIAIVALSNT